MPIHVLVVEDDHTIQEVIGIVLKDAGHRVSTLYDAKTIEETVETLNPSVILLDLTLPGIDGKTAAKKIKSNQKLASIPVVLLSGSSDIQKIMKEAGADDCLGKPFNITDLLAIVRKYGKRK